MRMTLPKDRDIEIEQFILERRRLRKREQKRQTGVKKFDDRFNARVFGTGKNYKP